MSTGTAIPDTQKAWISVKKAFPPSNSLELRKDWPVNKRLKSGEIIVKIHAAGMNPVGWKAMRLLPEWIAKRPYVVEHEFSGVVVEANRSTKLKRGDEVYGWLPLAQVVATKQGALQEYITLPELNFAKRPSNISEIEAAGVTLTALTALQGLNGAKLEAGQTLFVNGGSTAVGAWAIQIAKVRGARVVATCSKSSEPYVRSLGADEIIDYTATGPLQPYLTNNPPSTKYNVFFEAVGLFDSSIYTKSCAYLQPNGVFVSVGPMPDEFSWGVLPGYLKWFAVMTLPWIFTGVRQKGQIVAVNNKVEDIELLRKYLEEGKMKPTVDSVHEFNDILGAYERVMSGRARGKVIINISLPPSSGRASR
ncbi:quinone oxidoreductase [Ephemerocybe angulata]|uniref:Quinone oxidoreductase n=1 Tax=Ephemerocybe angulata TaxID=980116 RepID=A0A8H6IFZ2_9AGAR|nr:quinone oxidoreductase [Tulosesus angulatus]